MAAGDIGSIPIYESKMNATHASAENSYRFLWSFQIND